ncbi:cell wall hydrolase [Paenibacillus urinalis]|uniref:Cell wall hydrolase n=1 Tax=Paenibacillus urinalis TaxID=521520 RepID=A0ABY7X920_9BACL|nr:MULTISPECIES: cell wall hydrolase [Paenibacillus]OMC68847.1 cell wall hydrolase [Paenibacillus sp. FSL H7-0326]WDH97455.1 cell wall hydrolase [Paenibacillus urinalis]WDI01122.1 cell wall hydrolase [Paenibacillus urinalis]SDX11442.1 N-acetylmuramoyl-L-alanine amidase [Paenibacillus sp. PDC88]GAK39825.1 spore cortex-lytic enzyme prepeptide [Paenibacillus sp. TCA20]
MRKLTKRLMICAALLGAYGTVAAPAGASAAVMQQGIQSADVLDLQERLSSIGFMNAGSTGYYGKATEQAVRSFQKQFGLKIDGIAGPETISVLKKKAPINQTSLNQLAKAIHGEARGESFEGQVAVGAVILNRVQSDAFPDSITEVILQPRQFTAVDDGQYNLAPDETAIKAAKSALNGWDPSGGALYYYNPEIATSEWSKERPAIKQIGNHLFTN